MEKGQILNIFGEDVKIEDIIINDEPELNIIVLETPIKIEGEEYYNKYFFADDIKYITKKKKKL